MVFRGGSEPTCSPNKGVGAQKQWQSGKVKQEANHSIERLV